MVEHCTRSPGARGAQSRGREDHESQWAAALAQSSRRRLRVQLTRDDTAAHLLCNVCVIRHIWRRRGGVGYSGGLMDRALLRALTALITEAGATEAVVFL